MDGQTGGQAEKNRALSSFVGQAPILQGLSSVEKLPHTKSYSFCQNFEHLWLGLCII